MKIWSEWTPEEWQAWLDSLPEEPSGCIGCGAIAGCCSSYPNCPGNPNWGKDGADAVPKSVETDGANVRPAVDGKVRGDES